MSWHVNSSKQKEVPETIYYEMIPIRAFNDIEKPF